MPPVDRSRSFLTDPQRWPDDLRNRFGERMLSLFDVASDGKVRAKVDEICGHVAEHIVLEEDVRLNQLDTIPEEPEIDQIPEKPEIENNPTQLEKMKAKYKNSADGLLFSMVNACYLYFYFAEKNKGTLEEMIGFVYRSTGRSIKRKYIENFIELLVDVEEVVDDSGILRLNGSLDDLRDRFWTQPNGFTAISK